MNRQQWQQKREHYADSANTPPVASVASVDAPATATSGRAADAAIAPCEQATISPVDEAFASLRENESKH
jgi:hypothetical protein